MELIKKYSMWLWFALAVVVVIVGMIWEGQETRRWGGDESPVIDSFGDGIAEIPLVIGNWTGDVETQRDEIENEAISKESGAIYSLSRTYTSPDAPDTRVDINIICGYGRKLSIHTPTRCYVGSGYEIEGEVDTVEIPYPVSGQKVTDDESEKAEEHIARFKTAIFTKSGGGYNERIRVFWAWKTTEPTFNSPMFPRFTWRSATPLCKLYIITPVEKNEEILQNPVFSFGKVLFPELDVLLNGEFDSQNVDEFEASSADPESGEKKGASQEKEPEHYEIPDLVIPE